ncbi:hypothetical protein COLO4_16339 [Corchorus olitorius]|uniref:Uncharacterized protein n=1 Tax=Corchorus olitorius TaxID=93759 RepID=A0A1R3JHU8_9ROSI|nr:hypothetical protein COLO4_16339 [Corchorus olitorius]
MGESRASSGIRANVGVHVWDVRMGCPCGLIRYFLSLYWIRTTFPV